MGRSRKPVTAQAVRGFESLTLRQIEKAQDHDKSCAFFAQKLAVSTTYGRPAKATPEQNLAHPEQPEHTLLHEKCATCVQQTAARLTPEQLDALHVWQALTPELQEAVRALPNVSEAVKAGIVAMVKVATGR